MNAAEIERMSRLEGDHWWYRGLRDMIARTIARRRATLPDHPNLLDAGCGSGETLRFLSTCLDPQYIGGFDISPRAVDLASSKVAGADIYLSDICDPMLHVDRLDLIISCDVVSISGIERSRTGLMRLVSALSRGGLLILNLPAFQWMQSTHDRAIGTQDRLCTPRAAKLLREIGLEIELLTYRVFSLFPAIVASRLPGKFRMDLMNPPASDLRPTHPWVNRVLSTILKSENAAIEHGARFPFGSSVFAVGRKPL